MARSFLPEQLDTLQTLVQYGILTPMSLGRMLKNHAMNIKSLELNNDLCHNHAYRGRVIIAFENISLH